MLQVVSEAAFLLSIGIVVGMLATLALSRSLLAMLFGSAGPTSSTLLIYGIASAMSSPGYWRPDTATTMYCFPLTM
jgi:hypothetical protein